MLLHSSHFLSQFCQRAPKNILSCLSTFEGIYFTTFLPYSITLPVEVLYNKMCGLCIGYWASTNDCAVNYCGSLIRNSGTVCEMGRELPQTFIVVYYSYVFNPSLHSVAGFPTWGYKTIILGGRGNFG